LLSDILCGGGADVETGPDGWSQLMLAAFYGDTEISEILLNYGADINAANRFRFTPLLFAAQEGHLDEVKYLVESGAQISDRTLQGASALDLAVNGNHIEVVNYLLSQGLAPAPFGKSYSTKRIAEEYGFNEISEALKSDTLKSKAKITFEKPFFGFAHQISLTDYLIGIQGGTSEMNSKIDLTFGYQIRPFRKKY